MLNQMLQKIPQAMLVFNATLSFNQVLNVNVPMPIFSLLDQTWIPLLDALPILQTLSYVALLLSTMASLYFQVFGNQMESRLYIYINDDYDSDSILGL
jgi:hypothetical protein